MGVGQGKRDSTSVSSSRQSLRVHHDARRKPVPGDVPGRASGSPRSATPDWPRCASTILRHTCAAFLISSGAEAKDVQAHLGHASMTTTMGTYGHRFESRGRELADRLQSTWETRDTGTDGARLGHAAGSNVVKMRPDQDVS
jgi:integrase